MKTIKIIGLGLLLLALLGACTAGRQEFNDGRQLIESGRVEEGIARVLSAD